MSNHEKIYLLNPVYRPPSEHASLLIQLTEGCTYKCDFCVSNIHKNFRIRDIQDVKKDLDIGSRKKWGQNVRKIFFLDGNAMVTPTDKLLEVSNYAMEIFPHLERIGVYAHANDILKKSEKQLKALSDAGIKIAYVGFESGYNKLLQEINKHASKEDFIEASRKLMKAKITLSATFINGLGGSGNHDISKAHALESADLVNKICPNDDRIWYIAFLSLMVPLGTVIYDKKVKGDFKEMTATELLQELKLFIKNIRFQNKNAKCIFRSNHASNFLPIKGILDRDKDSIIKSIDSGLKHPEILRPYYYRGL